MNKINYLSRLNLASYFTNNTLLGIVGGKEDALNANITRWMKSGKIIQLKKGIFVTKEYLLLCKDKQTYCEFIANILKKPSYLSGEYVLQKYSILTESVFSITSVTRKKTRMYTNKLGVFLYSNIKEQLFTGYNIVSKSGFEIKEATKAKALFDFLYFRLLRITDINQEVVDSFRLNLGDLTSKDYKELESYINLSDIKKFSNLIKYLKETSK